MIEVISNIAVLQCRYELLQSSFNTTQECKSQPLRVTILQNEKKMVSSRLK